MVNMTIGDAIVFPQIKRNLSCGGYFGLLPNLDLGLNEKILWGALAAAFKLGELEMKFLS